MRSKSLNHSILKLAIPNIISNITVPLLGLVDMMLMGHLDSVVYIGAIGLGGTIFSVIYSIFSFMRAGTTGFTAQAYGAKDKSEISYAFYRSICIALIATVLVLVLQLPHDDDVVVVVLVVVEVQNLQQAKEQQHFDHSNVLHD